MITKYKSVFISDTHLGMKHINSKNLLNFISSVECENLFLVGDIIDGWSFSKKKWTKINSKIIKNFLFKKQNGTKIYYIVGNHDEFMRKYIGEYDDVIVANEYIYESDGKKYLILHGDLFDFIMIKAKWLARLGDILYDISFFLNRQYNFIRWLLGKDYFSFSQFAKEKIKNVTSFIGKYEYLIAKEAKKYNCDGVVSGHIHHACIKEMYGITYMNCGDWIESCTAIVEDFDGNFKILYWNEINKI